MLPFDIERKDAKAKKKLRELTSRRQGRNARQVMENVKVHIREWIAYFYVADMKRILQPEWQAHQWRNTRLGYCRIAGVRL